jgi:hypothetical protein
MVFNQLANHEKPSKPICVIDLGVGYDLVIVFLVCWIREKKKAEPLQTLP